MKKPPTPQKQCRPAFTLVELLVVIGIIALLISILLPALNKARDSANTIKCGANLHSIGLGMAMYLAENKSQFPPAYMYYGMSIATTPSNPVAGYISWSGFLFGNKSNLTSNSAFTTTSGWDMFKCPSFEKGGLPSSDTFAANLEPGQANWNNAPGGLSYPWNGCDSMAPRIAYTVNEAVCPRNKFAANAGARNYQFVRANQIRNSSETILATEFNQNWKVVQPSASSGCYSHRPVSGFMPTAGGNNVNFDTVAIGTSTTPGYRRAVATDLQGTAVAGTCLSTLDWVGRNHGARRIDATGKDLRQTNFLYVDGHVVAKSIYATLGPKFEWGENFYSVAQNGDLAY